MKYMEKLKEEHPECVSDEFAGGCEGCPEDYGYESRDEYCPDGLEGLGIEVACRKCWEREMPEGNTEKPDWRDTMLRKFDRRE